MNGFTARERDKFTAYLSKVSPEERDKILAMTAEEQRDLLSAMVARDGVLSQAISKATKATLSAIPPVSFDEDDEEFIRTNNTRDLEKKVLVAEAEANRYKKLNESLKDKVRDMKDEFLNSIAERDDYIKQISEQAMGVGTVLKTFPNIFTAEDFNEVEYVRVLRGCYAGKVGKLKGVDVDDENVSRATVEFTDGNIYKYIIDRKENVALPIIELDEENKERLIDNPHPQLYRPGITVMMKDDTRAVVLSRVDNSGNVLVLNSEDIPEKVFVGYDEFVAPVNCTAGVVYVLIKGEVLPVNLPQNSEIMVGDKVLLSSNGQIVQTSVECPVLYGANVTFKRMLTNDLMEVEMDGKLQLVHSILSNSIDLEEGTRIVLDTSNQVALLKVETEAPEGTFTDETGVDWDDIGGAEEAKEALRDAIEDPVKYFDLYKKYNKKPPKGICLYGPPGTGKTMLAKAAATSIQRLYGGVGADTAYIYQKGPQVLSQWVGRAEQSIREMFQQARDHKEKYGYPAILFIDEADAILSKRGSSRSSDVDKTIVPAFLAEMDGLEDSGCILILATNRPDSLDEAVVRPGRVDRKIKVGRPDSYTAKIILNSYMSKVPLAEGLSTLDLVNKTIDLLYSDELVAAVVKLQNRVLKLTQGMLTNGATLAVLVDLATDSALKRDKVTGVMSGVNFEDCKYAVRVLFNESINMNHDNDILELVGDKMKDVKAIEYAKEMPDVLSEF